MYPEIGRRSTNSDSQCCIWSRWRRLCIRRRTVCRTRVINSGRPHVGGEYPAKRRWRDRDIGSIVGSRFTHRNSIGPILRALCDITHLYMCEGRRRWRQTATCMYIIHVHLMARIRFVFRVRRTRTRGYMHAYRFESRRDSCLHKS